MRAVLVHGAATDERVWTATAAAWAGRAEVHRPRRPCRGDLDGEVAALAELCAGAVVVGVSGGATLGLELAARGVPIAAALLHEPAAGSLAPGLLDHVAEALRTDGVAGFGRALYGPAWTPSCTTADRATVERELAMFSAFEPRDLGPLADRVVLTVGERSPVARHDAVRAVAARLGVRWRVLPGAGHAAHLEGALLDPVLLDSVAPEVIR